jgi:hypothetical protein
MCAACTESLVEHDSGELLVHQAGPLQGAACLAASAATASAAHSDTCALGQRLERFGATSSRQGLHLPGTERRRSVRSVIEYRSSPTAGMLCCHALRLGPVST